MIRCDKRRVHVALSEIRVREPKPSDTPSVHLVTEVTTGRERLQRGHAGRGQEGVDRERLHDAPQHGMQCGTHGLWFSGIFRGMLLDTGWPCSSNCRRRNRGGGGHACQQSMTASTS